MLTKSLWPSQVGITLQLRDQRSFEPESQAEHNLHEKTATRPDMATAQDPQQPASYAGRTPLFFCVNFFHLQCSCQILHIQKIHFSVNNPFCQQILWAL